jgi:hypothetical protein
MVVRSMRSTAVAQVFAIGEPVMSRCTNGQMPPIVSTSLS